ncbi:uncharacterized protein LOC134208753 [Armigeres subalbatus]|uniref:uncharacterized protein LOC134208753 n=1 Tax=Armigeres subalbatus TaxID=124917 RepID=UPI002ED39AA4
MMAKASAGFPKRSQNKRRSFWSSVQIDLLLELWEDKIGALRGTRKNSHVFEEIRQSFNDHGYDVSATDIITRVHNLTARYKREKAALAQSGESQSEWPLFEKVNSILGSFQRPNVSSVIEDNSNGDNNSAPLPRPIDHPNNLASDNTKPSDDIIGNIDKSDASSPKRSRHKKRSWPPERIDLLLELWEDKIGALRETRKNSHVFAEIRQRFNEHGYDVSAGDIIRRIHKLTARYEREKAAMGPSGESPSEWPLFERVNYILGSFQTSSVRFVDEDSMDEDNSWLRHNDYYPNDLVASDDIIGTMDKAGVGTSKDNKLQKRSFWSAAQVDLLLKLWEDKVGAFRGGRQSSRAFRKIRRSFIDHGYDVSKKDIITRVHNITARYRREKAKMGRSGGTSSEWPLFERVHGILGSSRMHNVNDDSTDEDSSTSSLSTRMENLPDHDTSGPSQSNRHKRRSFWTSAQVDLLLNLWANKIGALRGARKNSHIFEDIRQSFIDHGYNVSAADIITRVHNLKARYKREKATMAQSGEVSEWPLFRKVHCILASLQSTNFSPGVEDSIDGGSGNTASLSNRLENELNRSTNSMASDPSDASIDAIDISSVKIEPESMDAELSYIDELLAHKNTRRRKAVNFCVLCLRKYSPKSLVKFNANAAFPLKNAVEPAEARKKLHETLGIDMDVENRNICVTCWKLVLLVADFKECCSKAMSNLELFQFGLDDYQRSEGWISETNLCGIEQNCNVIRKRIEFINEQVDTHIQSNTSGAVDRSPSKAVPPVEKVFVVSDVGLKAAETENKRKLSSTVIDPLMKFPKDLVVKRSKVDPRSDSCDSSIEVAPIDIKNENFDFESDNDRNENMDIGLTLPKKMRSSKNRMKSSAAKELTRLAYIDHALNILNDSSTSIEDEAAALDFLATNPDPSTSISCSKPWVKKKANQTKTLCSAEGIAEHGETETKSDSSKTVEAGNIEQTASVSKKNPSETITCVEDGEAMLDFLTKKPEPPKTFTKRGVLTKEHQVKVNNLYEVLDVLSTSKISKEDETIALDLLATKAKIINPKQKLLKTVRPKQITDINDATVDHYMASVHGDANYTRRKKSKPAEEPIHLEVDHYPVTISTCDICNRNFDNKHALFVHKTHCKPEAPSNDRFVSCPICTATFLDNSGLTFHLNRHKGIRPYKCRKFCDNTFFSNYTRIRHERKFCEREGRICPICGSHLKNEGNLLAHLKIVHGEAKHICGVCGQKFRSQQILRDHGRVHSEERKYACTQCDKAFKAPSSLKIHQRIHTNSLPFPCQLCDQVFNYKVSLKSHLERHHGPNQNWA